MIGLARIKCEGTINIENTKTGFLDDLKNVVFYLKNDKPIYFEGILDE